MPLIGPHRSTSRGGRAWMARHCAIQQRNVVSPTLSASEAFANE
jgi:hypothetical protein